MDSKIENSGHINVSDLNEGQNLRVYSSSIQVLDASARGHSGLTNGYITDLGSYHQCLRIKVRDALQDQPVDFNGQYCMVSINFPEVQRPKHNWLGVARKIDFSNTDLKNTLYEYYGNYSEIFTTETFSFALCIPSACSREELDKVVQRCE